MIVIFLNYELLLYETADTIIQYRFFVSLISQFWKWEILVGEGLYKYRTATVTCSTATFC